MRRQLFLRFAAVSALVVLAFAVPLAVFVQRTAEDRAIDAARADATAIVPALATGTTGDDVDVVVQSTASGAAGRVTVVGAAGWVVGPPTASQRLAEALESGRSSIGDTDGGVELVAAVATGPGRLSAIRILVPTSELRRGVAGAWLALGAVSVLLVAISVVVADRMARSIVAPTTSLAQAAAKLGTGDLAAQVDPSGPREIQVLGEEFNRLGAQVRQMLDDERELIAELSHRLRTPLTRLSVRIDEVDDPDTHEALRGDVDALTAEVTNLINEARGVSRRRPEASTTDLVEVVRSRVAFWEVLASDVGRPWTADLPDSEILVAAATSDVETALDVLFDNALAHTPPGAPVRVRVRSDGGRVLLVVEDGGAGFDEELSRRGASTAGSTGLGLDIVRGVAARYGGELLIDRSELGGAAVSLVLPTRSLQRRRRRRRRI
jgi:signal transduction histidine kinase